MSLPLRAMLLLLAMSLPRLALVIALVMMFSHVSHAAQHGVLHQDTRVSRQSPARSDQALVVQCLLGLSMGPSCCGMHSMHEHMTRLQGFCEIVLVVFAGAMLGALAQPLKSVQICVSSSAMP